LIIYLLKHVIKQYKYSNRRWAGQPGTRCTYSCPNSLTHNFQKLVKRLPVCPNNTVAAYYKITTKYKKENWKKNF